MASIKTLLIVKILTLWNYISELYKKFKNETIYFLTYLGNYFQGSHDIWVWLESSMYPISIDKVDNRVFIDWYYNNHTKLLDHYTKDNENEVFCKCAWLSANVRIIDFNVSSEQAVEYNIDDFIEKFRIKTSTDKVPTLSTIFLSWCIHSKHWFSASSYVEFNIIDEMGETISINLDEHNESLEIKYNKICVIVHNADEKLVNFTNQLVITETEKNKDI